MTQVIAQFNFSEQQIADLSAPLHEDQIRERKGGGKMLKYIKADMAIDTANRIFGFGQWGYKVVSRGHMIIEDPKKGKIEMYTADVELSVVGAAFPFPGGGVGIVNDPYTVEMHEKAYKEAETDAMKRALRHYGDQFGLSLYNEDDPIEGRDGTIKPVKAAEVRNHPVQADRRVVEAAQPARQLPPAQQQQPRPTAQSMNVANDPINAGQLRGIEDLLIHKLQRPFAREEYQGLTAMQAAGLIQQLTSEWNVVQRNKANNRAQVGAK